MTNNNTINEFDLQYFDGTYHLISSKLFNKEFLEFDNTFIWNFLTNKYVIKDVLMPCVWLFFVTDEIRLKGFIRWI